MIFVDLKKQLPGGRTGTRNDEPLKTLIFKMKNEKSVLIIRPENKQTIKCKNDISIVSIYVAIINKIQIVYRQNISCLL